MNGLFLPHAVVWIIILPFISGLLAYISGCRIGRYCGIGTACLLQALMVKLAWEVTSSGPIRYAIGGWRSPLGIDLKLDGFSLLMLLCTALVGLAVSIFAFGYFTCSGDSFERRTKAERAGYYFWTLWMIAWGGLNALFLTSDIFNIYVCLEVMTFAAIALITIAGNVPAVVAALRYLFMSAIGSLSYLMGVGLLYSAYGTLDLASLSTLLEPGLLSGSAIALMTLGLMIKAALFPMHFWLPPAHSNAPAPVSAILSGLVVMAAFYLLVRLWFETFTLALSPIHSQLLGALGVLTIFYGSLHALREERLKMLVAYSTVAQVGYMFLIFPLVAVDTFGERFAWSGGIYFALSHACAKASVFMVAGSIMYSLGHDRIGELQGLARRFPIAIFTFGLAGLSLAGLPPSGGFVAKWQLLKAAMLTGQWWYALVMIIGSLLTAGYIFRVIEVSLRAPGKEAEESERLPIPMKMQYSALALSIAAILMGLGASVPLDMMKIGNPLFENKGSSYLQEER
jgi:multicomponent Na+:H+ antiporter subunit D